ncbi:MAG: NAD(P)H-binding protein [Bacillota bacterium]|nr:NAD(P)H-binding protein [Bacillota bacterium]
MLLVTGITGHSGRYFLQELINNKYEGPIRCIVRETSDTSMLDNSGLNIEKVYGNLSDKNIIKNSVNGVDAIMHIYNIYHSPTIVEEAIANNVSRAILVHTAGIYSNFKFASQRYKEVEKKVNKLTSVSGCPTKVTILRPTMIYGDLCDSNMSKFIKMIDKFRIMPLIDGGKSLIQPVNARDLGRAFYDVLMSPQKTAGKKYDLSGEQPLSMILVFKMISDNLNKKTTFISIPLWVGVLLARAVKISTFGRIDFVEQMRRMGEDRSLSHSEALKDFGFSPMPFEDGIRLEVEQYIDCYRNAKM